VVPGDGGKDDQVSLLRRLRANHDRQRELYPGLNVMMLDRHHHSPDRISLVLDSMGGELKQYRVKPKDSDAVTKQLITVGRQHLLLLTSPFAEPLHKMTENDAFTMFYDIFQSICSYMAS
jgi:hypothetical protein